MRERARLMLTTHHVGEEAVHRIVGICRTVLTCRRLIRRIDRREVTRPIGARISRRYCLVVHSSVIPARENASANERSLCSDSLVEK